MSGTIKTILLVLIAALVGVLAYVKLKPVEETGPFAGMGIRYDGYYRAKRGSVFYLIRFFPEGRAVTINGKPDMEKQLPSFLTRTTSGNPDMGLYNVMVDVRGDSLFFTTHPVRGEISYRGKLMNSELVRFHRHSHINGVNYDLDYPFIQSDSLPQ